LREAASPSLGAFKARRDLGFWYWTFSLAWIGFLTSSVLGGARPTGASIVELVPWLGLVIVFDLVAVKLPPEGAFHGALAANPPILVAAALVLPPLATGAVATLGMFDPAEWRHSIRFSRALFNRSAAGLSAYVAAVTVQSLSDAPATPPIVLGTACLAVVVCEGLDFILQWGALVVEHGLPARKTAAELLPGSRMDFALTLSAWAMIGALLAALYVEIGLIALPLIVPPAMLARQVLTRSQALLDARRAYSEREDALVELSKRIFSERADERRLIGEQLHDDVMQPLYKVNLMSEVIRIDLAQGRLLDLDKDMADLRSAVQAATDHLRAVVTNVRRAELGTGSVSEAISNLVSRAQAESTIAIESSISLVRADPGPQLTMYQVAKEALENSMKHARATRLTVHLSEDDTSLVLTISDDGVGFDPAHSPAGHFGLTIMRERVSALGGSIYIDTCPGEGCRITAVLPRASTKASQETGHTN
jgi:signal transduction histidine kinase